MKRERYMNEIDHLELVPFADGRPVVMVTKMVDFSGREARQGEKYPVRHLCEHPAHPEGLTACIHLRTSEDAPSDAYTFLFPGEWRWVNERDLYNVRIHKYVYGGIGEGVHDSGESYVADRINAFNGDKPRKLAQKPRFKVAEDTPL